MICTKCFERILHYRFHNCVSTELSHYTFIEVERILWLNKKICFLTVLRRLINFRQSTIFDRKCTIECTYLYIRVIFRVEEWILLNSREWWPLVSKELIFIFQSICFISCHIFCWISSQWHYVFSRKCSCGQPHTNFHKLRRSTCNKHRFQVRLFHSLFCSHSPIISCTWHDFQRLTLKIRQALFYENINWVNVLRII